MLGRSSDFLLPDSVRDRILTEGHFRFQVRKIKTLCWQKITYAHLMGRG